MRRVDHSFVDARPYETSINFEEAHMEFAVLAEKGDERMVAKLCFISYRYGQGRKIFLKRPRNPHP